MTPALANRINRAVFFTVVIYIIAVCVAVGLGDRGVMAAAGQALVVVPFAIIAAIFGGLFLAYAFSALLGVATLIIMALCLIVGRKETALQVSERVETFEQKIADKLLPSKDQND